MPTSIQVSLVCPNCQGQVISFFDTRNGYHHGECFDCGKRFTEEEIEKMDEEQTDKLWCHQCGNKDLVSEGPAEGYWCPECGSSDSDE